MTKVRKPAPADLAYAAGLLALIDSPDRNACSRVSARLARLAGVRLPVPHGTERVSRADAEIAATALAGAWSMGGWLVHEYDVAHWLRTTDGSDD